MLSGGITMLGDSRLDNVRRLREAGIDCEVWLLRSPAFIEVDDVVRSTQVSLNSEVAVVPASTKGRLEEIQPFGPRPRSSERRSTSS
jgi:predicted amino acid racemase